MKRTYILIVSLALVVFSSCHHDDPEVGVDFNKLPNLGKSFMPTSEHDHDVSEQPSFQRLIQYQEEDSQSAQPQPAKVSSLVLTDLARGILESLLSRNIHQVCGTYESVDAYGNPITLSGAIFYPLDGPIKNIIICSHYTVAADYEVPSRSFPLEASLAAKGYAVVMPDYIGYGASKDKVHPYLQEYLTATNVIDMALAVRPFFASRNLVVESEEVILMGYSQGGGTTIFVQYCMENMPQYANCFRIKKSYCGGGPYDVARTYDYCVKLDETGIPYAVPMIILGMSEGMPEPLNMETFFQEPLLSHYHEWFTSKQYNGGQITTLIGAHRLSQILTPAGLDRTNGETLRLYKELQANSLPSYFRPKAPLYVFHSMDDQTVPFINAQTLQYNLTHYSAADNVPPIYTVEYDFDHYGNHQAGCIKFYLKMFKTL